MNANCYKTIFSERLGALIAVGEHASCAAKAASGQAQLGREAASTPALTMMEGFVGVLRLTFASVALTCITLSATQAQSGSNLFSNLLPQGGSVNTGSVTIGTNGAQMTINQTTDKASIDWQSFNIGSGASVNITQPNTSSVLLNRVVGNDPSQILGKLSANGQVILINPNGIVFGKDGSVTASAFTASTFGLSDADFMDGLYKYKRNGSTASVFNQGSIQTASGGFVALIGATVTNEGVIRSPQGDVMLVAAENVTLPTQATTVGVRMNKRVRLELDPAAINTAVKNTESGVIVTEGGQVLLQAAALSTAVASVTHSGHIDTSAPQAGAVTVLADGGAIKVNGSITANSSGQTDGKANRGGDIIIGRDEASGALSKFTDVSAAKLESDKGFVETSGDVLSTTGTRVKASEWLLDPTNITIAASGATGTPYASNYTGATDSIILASDISANLTAGTSVTLATGAGGTSLGNIAVNESISKTGGSDATLTLQAHGNITVAASKTITSNTGKLNVVFNSDSDGANGGAIYLSTGAGISSNGGNITLGGGTALDGTGFAVADGESTLQGISTYSANINAGGGNISMKGKTAATNYSGSLPNISGMYISGGAISTSGSGTIDLSGYNQNTDTQSKAIEIASGTITGGSSGTVTITGDSRGMASTPFDYIRGALLNGTITSTGGNINITGYGGAGARYDYGVDIGGSVMAQGTGTVTITGKAGSGGSGGNVGVNTGGTGTISSVDGAISITGTGGLGGLNNHGVQIGSSNAVKSTGSGNISVTGRAINSDTTYSKGVIIGGAGISTNSGNIKLDGQVPNNYQLAVNINAAVTASTGNVYIRSASAGIANSATGVISGNNVSIDNTGGTIDANGVITKGAGGATTWAGYIARNGIDLSGSVTAANNLNIYGNQTNTEVGVRISGATTTVSGKNVTLYGNSSTGNGVLLSGATLSGAYINATGVTNTGATGFAWQGGNINTTGTTGTSTASVVKGISAASTTTNGYGALMMIANSATNAATGTTLTLAGDATTSTTGLNTKERGILVQSGYTLTTSGDITLDGSSKSGEGISFGSTINVTGTNSKLTIKGTAAATSNANLNALGFSGTLNNNGTNTQPITFIGEAKNQSGTNIDTAVNISGTVNGGTANVNVQAKYGKIAISAGTAGAAINGANISIDNTFGTIDATTGAITEGAGTSNYTNAIDVSGVLNVALNASGNVNILGKVANTTHTGVNTTTVAAITSTGTAANINIASNGNLVSAAALKVTGATGGGSNINLTSTNGTITGAGAIGDTTNKNGSVTFTQGSTSTYDGAINAANFTKAGTGALTLDSWSLVSPSTAVATNISNAYTIKGGGSLSLSPGGTYVQMNPQSVNVENASTFALSSSGNGWWKNTAFNFTGGNGGGTMNLLGNPIGAASTTNTFSTSGGTTNIISGVFNANNANVNFNLTSASSGTSLSDGSFAALAFTQNSSGGYGLGSGGGGASTVNVSGGGNLLIKDKFNATNLNINAGSVQFGDGTAATTASTAELQVTNVNIATGSKLIFNRAEAHTNTSMFTGSGNLIQAGAGTMTLAGNSSSFAGSTTVNAGKTLALGTGSSLGASGSTMTLVDSASQLHFTGASGVSSVGSAINGAGKVTQSGAGTTILLADNSYAGTTTVSGGTLQVGNAGTTGTLGAGDASMSNNANLRYVLAETTTITNNISGAGNVSADITGTTSDLTVNRTIALTAGTVNLNADRNLSVTQAISTSNDTSSAVLLISGKATDAGVSPGGDVTVSGNGMVTTGPSGRVTYMTGSIAGSTGLGVTTGNNRYNSDEFTTSYTAALGSGTYAIYREKPLVTVAVNSVTKTYNGNAFNGGSLSTTLASGELVKGDSFATVTANAAYGGTAQDAKNASSTPYVISASDTGGLSALGYGVTYTPGNLTINKANLTVTANDDARFVGRTDATNYGGVNYTGFVNGETSSVLGGALTVIRTNSAMDAGVYTDVLSADGLTSVNYNIAYTTGSYTIVPANQLLIRTASANVSYGTTPVYDTTAQYLDDHSNAIITLTRTGTGNNYTFNDGLSTTVNAMLKPYAGTSLAATSTSGNTIVGTYNITDINPTVVGANFVGAPVFVGNLTVNTKEITPKASGVSKVYDGTTAMNNVVVGLTGKLNADKVSISGTGEFSQKHVGVNLGYTVSDITLSGTDASNYHLSGGNTSFSGSNGIITPAPLVLTTSNVVKTYDGSTSALGSAITTQNTQLFGSDTLNGGAFAFTDKNAGTANKVVEVSAVTVDDGNNGQNYSVTYAQNTTSTISKAALTLTANSDNGKVYNGTEQNVSGFAITSGSLQGTDSVSVDLMAITAGAKGTHAGTYTATINDANYTNGNYEITKVNGSLFIDQKEVSLAAAKIYDGNKTLTGTQLSVTTGVGSETLAYTNATINSKNVADNSSNYVNAITLLDGTNGGLANNYKLPSLTAAVSNVNSVALAAKVLTGSIADVTATYGTPAGTGAVSLSGKIGTDEVMAANTANVVNASSSSSGHLKADRYIQTVDAGLTGADADNYSFSGATTVTGNYLVNKLALTGFITKGETTYGSSLMAGPVSLTNKVEADDVNVSGVIIDTSGKTSTSGHLKADHYTDIQSVNSLSGTDKDNYSFANIKGDYLVNKLTLTRAVIADVTTTFATAADAGAVSFGNVQGSDKVTSSASIVDAATSSSGNLKAGSYKQTATAISGDDASNYSFAGITTTDKNYVVNKLALTGAAITGVTTTYATAADAGAVSFGNVQVADKVTSSASIVDAATSTSGNLKAGSYKQTATAITGDDAANYSFTGVTTADKNYVVNKLALTGAAIAGVTTTYATAVDAGAVTFSNVQSGDKVNSSAFLVDATTSTSGNLKAGSYKQTATAITGDDASNYSFSGVTTTDKNYVVNKLALTNAAIAGVTTTYATVADTGSVTFSNVQGIDKVTSAASIVDAATSTSGNLKAGSYKQTATAISGDDASNYSFAGVTTTDNNYVVNKLALTDASIAGVTTTYATAADAGVMTFGNVQIGDKVTSAASIMDVATSTSGNLKAGSYKQTATAISGDDASNYSFAGVTSDKNYVVSKLALTGAAIADVTTTYATAADAGAVSFGNVQGSDKVTSSASIVDAATSTSGNLKAGSYKQTATAISGDDASNYSFAGVTSADKNYVVNRKLITLSGVTSDNKAYDGNTSATVSVTNAVFKDMQNGDKLTVASTGTFSDKNASTHKTVSLINTLSGADADNYSVTVQTTTTADISKKDVTLSGITSANKTYDGNTEATITSGAIATGVSTETLAISGMGTFSDKDAALGKSVTVADIATLTKTNGTGDWDNYNLTSSGSATTTANIIPKNVFLESINAANKMFDGTTKATITSGVINTGIGTETLLIAGQGTFADPAPGTQKTVTVNDVSSLTRTNGTGNWNNYKLSTTGSATTKATITAQSSTSVPPISPIDSKKPISRTKVNPVTSPLSQLTLSKDFADDTCLENDPENCVCEASTVHKEVVICHDKKKYRSLLTERSSK